MSCNTAAMYAASSFARYSQHWDKVYLLGLLCAAFVTCLHKEDISTLLSTTLLTIGMSTAEASQHLHHTAVCFDDRFLAMRPTAAGFAVQTELSG